MSFQEKITPFGDFSMLARMILQPKLLDDVDFLLNVGLENDVLDAVFRPGTLGVGVYEEQKLLLSLVSPITSKGAISFTCAKLNLSSSNGQSANPPHSSFRNKVSLSTC